MSERQGRQGLCRLLRPKHWGRRRFGGKDPEITCGCAEACWTSRWNVLAAVRV